MEPLRKEWFKWFGLDSIRHHRKVDESNGYSNLSMDEPRCNLSTKMRIPQQNLAQLRQLSDMRSLLDNGTPEEEASNLELLWRLATQSVFFCSISLDWQSSSDLSFLNRTLWTHFEVQCLSGVQIYHISSHLRPEKVCFRYHHMSWGYNMMMRSMNAAKQSRVGTGWSARAWSRRWGTWWPALYIDESCVLEVHFKDTGWSRYK